MRAIPKLVTVVVPVFNEVDDLPGQLAALAEQTYTEPWELLICDNGSTDGTQALARSWQHKLPGLRVIDASGRQGCNHARNVGIEHASGDFIAFVDADDVACPGWLEALVDAAPSADIVAGPLDELADPLPRLPAELRVLYGFLPSFPGGNCGVWTTVARAVPWDEDYVVGGTDIEFAWRVQLAGYRLAYARDAVVSVRRPTRLRTIARQWYGYGTAEALLFRRFRHRGMPRSSAKIASVNWAWLVLHLMDLARGPTRRVRWIQKASRRGGRIVGSVRYRVVFL